MISERVKRLVRKLNRDQRSMIAVIVTCLLIFGVVGGYGFVAWAFGPQPASVPCCGDVTYAPGKVDALWFVVQTLTTTGYGSLPVWTPSLKLISIALMCGGATLWTVLLGLLINITDAALRD